MCHLVPLFHSFNTIILEVIGLFCPFDFNTFIFKPMTIYVLRLSSITAANKKIRIFAEYVHTFYTFKWYLNYIQRKPFTYLARQECLHPKKNWGLLQSSLLMNSILVCMFSNIWANKTTSTLRKITDLCILRSILYLSMHSLLKALFLS